MSTPMPINLNVKTFSPGMEAKPGQRSTFHLMITAEVCKSEGKTQLPTDLVLVIDGSGSMGQPIPGTEDVKMDKVKEAAQAALDGLSPQDRIAVVRFASTAETLLPLTPCDSRGKTKAGNVIWGLRSGGGTSFASGLSEALQILGAKVQGRNRVALKLTDGENTDTMNDPLPICASMKETGITLYIAGLGVQNTLEAYLQGMAKANSAETNFRGLTSSADVSAFFADVQAAATGTVIKNAQLKITPVQFAQIGNFELVTRAKQLNYVGVDDTKQPEPTITIGDIGAEEPLDFYLNMGVILPEDTKPGRRSFGKIELVGEVVATGEKGTLRSGNIVVPFVDKLDPNAQADPEVREMMSIAAAAREAAVFEKTGNQESLKKAVESARKTQAFKRGDVAKLLQQQLESIQQTAAANPDAAQQQARRATRSFSASDRAKLLGNLKK